MRDTRKEKFIERLHKIDERFSTILAWEGNYKTGKGTILMTPATEFYRMYKDEIERIERENEGLKQKLREICKLSNLKSKEE